VLQSVSSSDSKEILSRILRASADLLTEEGLDHLSIRRIAMRAKVDSSTVIQFYPTKYAVISALYEEWIRGAQKVFEDADNKLLTASSWKPFFVDFLKAYEHVGFSAELETELTGAMAAFGELRRLDQEYLDWAVDKLTSYIQHFSPACTNDCSKAMAVLILEWDLALSHQEHSYGGSIHKHLVKMTWEGLLHLLEVCIEKEPSFADANPCGPGACC